MPALPGEHYCKDHQGYLGQYDPKNCTVCRLQGEISRFQSASDSTILRKQAEAVERLKDFNYVAFGTTGMAIDILDITTEAQRLRQQADELEDEQETDAESYKHTLKRAIAMFEVECEKCGPDRIGDAIWFETDIDRLKELLEKVHLLVK